MEQLLWLYQRPYDALHPVVCFDERPCFLIGDVLEPTSLRSGHVRREHYTYTKHGSCSLLAAIEPLTGKRLAHVKPQRSKKEYAFFLRDLARRYPKAVKIHLVQDNLNTHTFGALYEHFPPEQAFTLAQRFEFHYTPKCASWLNMIEIEFSAIARQCLKRRIPSMEQLTAEVLSLVRYRERKKIKISWQFSIQTARTTLNRHYLEVFKGNHNKQ
jgi:hypothetical protein